MRVLVTGGAGFIGSHVVDAYLDEGHRVLVVDDLSHGRVENVHARAEFENADVRDGNGMARILRTFRPKVVNHHAAQIDPRLSVGDPLLDARTNVIGTVNLLHLCAGNGIRAFVFASSGGAIYGEREDAADECSPVAPLSPYGAAKVAAEGYLFVFARTLGLNAASIRYGNVYGPRQGRSGEAGVIPIFVRRMLGNEKVEIFGDGEQTRDFVYVADAARANLAATEYLLQRKQSVATIDDLAFNVSSGVAVSINDLYGRLAQTTGYTGSPVYEDAKKGDIRHSVLSPAKAERVLGFRPELSLDEGLRVTVEWFKGQPASD